MCHHRSLEKTNNVKPTGVPCVWQWHSSLVFYSPEQDDNTYGDAIAAAVVVVVVVVVVVAVDAIIIVAVVVGVWLRRVRELGGLTGASAPSYCRERAGLDFDLLGISWRQRVSRFLTG